MFKEIALFRTNYKTIDSDFPLLGGVHFQALDQKSLICSISFLPENVSQEKLKEVAD